jgi:hypothetical protein
VANWRGPSIGFVSLADGKVRRRAVGEQPRLFESDGAAYLVMAIEGSVAKVDTAAAIISPLFTARSCVSLVAGSGVAWLLEGDPGRRDPSSRMRRFSLSDGTETGRIDVREPASGLVLGKLGVWGVSEKHVSLIAGLDGAVVGRVWPAERGERWAGVDADRGLAFAVVTSRSNRDRGPTTLVCRGLGV